MPRTLSDEVLGVLRESRAASGPVSLAYLARRFGVSSALMRSCARQLVAAGSAQASMADMHGVSTIMGLQPEVQPVAAAVAQDADS